MPSNNSTMTLLQSCKDIQRLYLYTMPKYAFACLITVFCLRVNDGFCKAIDIQNNSISIALSTEPPDLNSMTSTDQISFFVLEHINEGLLTYDSEGKLAPGIAEHWAFDGTTVRLQLRHDALWSDGQPVTAHDFIFAWRTLLEPETASRYAFILFPIKNAQKINEGTLPAEALAVKAIDDYALSIELATPTPWFLSLLTFASYFPIREDFYTRQQGRYAADAENLLFNGPFTLDNWVHGASLTLSKNPRYWNSKNIHLDKITVSHITQDSQARFNMFRDNEIALTELDSETLESALQLRLLIKTFQTGALAYLEFNHRPGKPTANLNLRKAIQHVFDPDEVTYKVAGVPGNIPAWSLFPRWLKGVERPFWQEYPVKKPAIDPSTAIQYLELAKQELGLEEIPPLSYLVTDQPGTVKQAEYFQNLMKRKLGLDIVIDKQTFKQRLAKMASGDFDIVSAGWGPDYNDHSTFSDLFVSDNENNHGLYKNAEYDQLILESRHQQDSEKRMQLFARAQDILVEDVALLPRMESGMTYVQNKQLKGVVRRIFGGDPSFRFAWIEQTGSKR
ncbi:MAG: peptide ABC transporter substrate-binding protein [Pseudomonadales bacterium]|nr:peptide ABC transporter substrate-binding protein [Pseudomonadales bacterium]